MHRTLNFKLQKQGLVHADDKSVVFESHAHNGMMFVMPQITWSTMGRPSVVTVVMGRMDDA